MPKEKEVVPPVSGDGETDDDNQITFHYIKSNSFRVIHADGMWGGISPSGHLQMAFYNERIPIPQMTVHAVDPVKRIIGEEEERLVRDGIVREVECNVVMSLEVSERLHRWLGVQIESLKKAKEDYERRKGEKR